MIAMFIYIEIRKIYTSVQNFMKIINITEGFGGGASADKNLPNLSASYYAYLLF